jgi:sugar (pentulose or hexulose) kinase
MTAATVAVFDVGKSNVKLSACSAEGRVVETLAAPNPVRPGPPWRHHDLDAVEAWLLDGLAQLASRHPLQDVIATGHGSGCVLVTADPDAPPALPMFDYEQPIAPEVDAAYRAEAGDIWDRGSAVMMASTHSARQMFWAETARPEDFAAARWSLPVPQYWAFRLSGQAVTEASSLGAQSQLWNVRDRAYAAIVTRRGWIRLMPPLARASEVLGPIRADLCRRHGLPPLKVHVGAHDSSSAFHRYQAAGLSGFAAVSTGTWIVALTDAGLPATIDEARGMTINADMDGRPILGALTMGGREFSAVAGAQPDGALADPAAIARLVARDSVALPTFGSNDGQFPGSAGRGRIAGPAPADPAERLALALLYTALLTHTCGTLVAPDLPWVLDGSWLRDPAFPGLVAALRPGRRTDISPEPYGIAAGAAVMCGTGRAPLALTPATPLAIPGLIPYAARWRALTEGHPG